MAMSASRGTERRIKKAVYECVRLIARRDPRVFLSVRVDQRQFRGVTKMDAVDWMMVRGGSII